MATKGNVRLAAMITKQGMNSIEKGYFGLNKQTVKILESENKDDIEAFNRAVIKKWEHMNPCDNQIKVSFS